MSKSTTAFKTCGTADNLRTQFNQLRTDYNTLIAKLNADAGITDTDYASTTAAALTES